MSETFAHAVASFDPTSDAVLLWTRLTGATTAEWVVARDATLHDVVARGTETTGPDRDWTVTVDATGLEPATTYWYRFTAGDDVSPVGRTRTLPAGDVDAVTLGLVCCADYARAPLTVYRALAQREVDLVVHLGDYVYETGEGHRRDPDPPHEIRTLADYRRRYAQLRADADCRALHLRHPMVAIVDDHDVADNAWRGGSKHHDEEREGPWADRVRAALTARTEWVPVRRHDPDDPVCTWRSLAVGDLAELVLLDTRLAGRDEQADEPGAPPLLAPDRRLLDDEQRAWAFERVNDPTRPWLLFANGVVVNSLVLSPPFAHAFAPLLPEGYAEHDGVLLRDDQWDGYPAERDRLVAELAKRRRAGGATVLLSGDVHSSWAMEGPLDGGGEPVAVEVVTPAVSSPPMGQTRLPSVWRLLDAAVRRLEHVRYVDIANRGFVLLRVTRDRVTAGWHFVDPYDTSAEPSVEADRWLAADRDEPRWRDVEPVADPWRPGLPEPLPDRPADLPVLRRRHVRRRALDQALSAAALTTAIAAVRRRRRR
ncbi:MAG TPA: alkaline phosphatase D family protein [Frankiaceae bacterium]|nr:alkaline phosphatase D family protein [Frankiaceae bacterium]